MEDQDQTSGLRDSKADKETYKKTKLEYLQTMLNNNKNNVIVIANVPGQQAGVVEYAGLLFAGLLAERPINMLVYIRVNLLKEL